MHQMTRRTIRYYFIRIAARTLPLSTTAELPIDRSEPHYHFFKALSSISAQLYHVSTFCSALDDFNNAVVLTNRPLKINEVFEVRIDKMVTKWTGSIEIGVTTHAPTELEYPSTMTNVR